MAYLEKQDLSTLKISHVIKASLYSSITACIITAIFSGQVVSISYDIGHTFSHYFNDITFSQLHLGVRYNH